MIEKVERGVPQKGEGLRRFNVFVNDEFFEVGVDEVAKTPVVRSVRQAPVQTAPVVTKPAAAASTESTAAGTLLTAPMPGMIVSVEKKIGDSVTKGETVIVIEAMKMENALPAVADGMIKDIKCASGDIVKKNDVLCVIG